MNRDSKTVFIATGIMFIVCIVGVAMELDTTLTVVAAFIIAGAVGFVLMQFNDKKRLEEKLSIDFSSGSGAPTLKKRCETSAKAFKIKPLYNHDFDYHPTTVTYTSVTVGGVTTGGFDVNKEHYSSRRTGASGKYALFSVEEDYEICRIILSDSLLESARSNPFIKRFLKGHDLVLEHENENTKLSAGAMANLEGYIKSGNVISQNLWMQDVINAKKLTKEECQKILDWIGGK